MSKQHLGGHRPAARVTAKPKPKPKPLRIGIYAGAFDPVHAGHVAFALQAMEAAHLDQIVFMPERRPRYKPSVEHYAHRIAMLKTALAPHPDLSVMEVVDKYFTVRRTLPMLQQAFRGAEFAFLMGSDTAVTIPHWQHSSQLLTSSELVIGVRSSHQRTILEMALGEWRTLPKALIMFDSFAPHVSSSQVRQALRENQHTDGLLSSVRRYAREEWLYVSPGQYVV